MVANNSAASAQLCLQPSRYIHPFISVSCQITVRQSDIPTFKLFLQRCFNYLQILHCPRCFPNELTVETRLNDAVIAVLFCHIVITLTDTRPSVSPSGLGEAGGSQSSVYKHRKTFTNSLGKQNETNIKKSKHLHGLEQMWGPEYINLYKIIHTPLNQTLCISTNIINT